MPITEQMWQGLFKNIEHNLIHKQTSSPSATTRRQNQYLWLVLLRGQESYFLLLALTLHTWWQLLLGHAGFSLSQDTQLIPCQAPGHSR